MTYGLAPTRRSFLVAIAGIVTLFAQCAAAATYYVATTGSDSNPGTSSAPFLTLQKAANTAIAGDTVIVGNGTYGNNGAVTGGDGANNEASAVILQHSGTAGAPITFEAATPGGAILSCQMLCDSYINLYNSSYIVIQGFVITQGYKAALWSQRLQPVTSLCETTLSTTLQTALLLSTLGLPGLYANANSSNFVIDGNVFHDIGRTTTNQLDHALYLEGTGYTITNNIFYNIPNGWSIQMAGTNNVLIANNTPFAFSDVSAEGGTGQIMMWESQAGVTIENNIFYKPSNAAITTYANSVSNCTISNNLIYGASTVLSGSNGCSVGTNLIGGNPNFVNAATAPYNFAAQAGGAGINAGVYLAAVPNDFTGAARPTGTVTDNMANTMRPNQAPPAVTISGDFCFRDYDQFGNHYVDDQPCRRDFVQRNGVA